MTRSIGLVVVNTVDECELSEVSSRLREGRSKTPSGRHLVLLWEAPTRWVQSPPIEGLATRLMLGEPTDRDKAEWHLDGNGAIRLYRSRATSPSRTLRWVAFRRTGDRAYTRRSQISAEVSVESRLETVHPVFTRDVANNVWHLPLQFGVPSTIRRFQSLLTWADESTVVISATGSRRLRHRRLEMDSALVPRAEKLPYSFPTSGDVTL